MTHDELEKLPPDLRQEIERRHQEYTISDADLDSANVLLVEFQLKLGAEFGSQRLVPIMANLMGGWLSQAMLDDVGNSVFATVSEWLHIAHRQHSGPLCDLIIHGYGGYSEAYGAEGSDTVAADFDLRGELQ